MAAVLGLTTVLVPATSEPAAAQRAIAQISSVELAQSLAADKQDIYLVDLRTPCRVCSQADPRRDVSDR